VLLVILFHAGCAWLRSAPASRASPRLDPTWRGAEGRALAKKAAETLARLQQKHGDRFSYQTVRATV